MKYLEIGLFATLILSVLIILVFLSKTKKPLKNAVLSILISFVLLAIINNLTFVTGIYVPVNWYTVIAAGVYGIPGIIGIIIMQTIFLL